LASPYKSQKLVAVSILSPDLSSGVFQDNNAERATDWILNHPDEADQPMETESASDSSGPQYKDGSPSKSLEQSAGLSMPAIVFWGWVSVALLRILFRMNYQHIARAALQYPESTSSNTPKC